MPSTFQLRHKQPVFSPRGKVLAALCCTLLVAGCQTPVSDEDFALTHGINSKRYHNYTADGRYIPAQNWEGEQLPPSPLAHKDIWERMRAGFKLQQMPDNQRVAQHRKRFSSNPATLRAVSKRSAPYIHYIVERLEEQNMPLELALLPIIESSYNPFAYSPAQAAGLWQFIPSTGQQYNLRQTRWYDGRRDITASTNAALRYLSYLHDYFNGDWLLALAAYNAGEGTVGKAIEANQRQGLPTDYWSLPLPQETRDYVPKLLAVSQLVMNPQSHNISLTPVPNQPYFEVVRLNRKVNLSHAAKLADLDEEELYRLNPAFTKGVTQDGPRQLLVPTEKADALTSNLAQLDENGADEPLERVASLPEPTLNWDIPRRMSSRYGSDRMQEVNRAIVREIQASETLGGGRKRIEHILSPVANVKISTSIVTASESSSEKRPSNTRTYRVKNGESLQQISKAQKVSAADLQRWNSIPGGRLKPGQVLNLQAPAPTNPSSKSDGKGKPVASNSKAATPAVANAKGNATKAAAAQPATLYKVKKGESIQQIAKRFNVQPKTLQNWNQLSGGQDIKPGQMLTLYLPR